MIVKIKANICILIDNKRESTYYYIYNEKSSSFDMIQINIKPTITK